MIPGSKRELYIRWLYSPECLPEPPAEYRFRKTERRRPMWERKGVSEDPREYEDDE